MACIAVALTGTLRGGLFIMLKPPDYDAFEQILWRKQAKEVIDCLDNNDKNILKKIQTYIWRFGYTEEEIKAHIRRNEMFAAWFTKEPRRMKLHETVAADWLSGIDLISDFESLPTGGKNAWYIAIDGDLRQGKKPAGVKSLDFGWTTGQYRVFASHKYTKESGGNQDSQFQEVQAMLRFFQQGAVDDHTVVLAIVDGPYYTPKKMSELHRFERINKPMSKALHIEEVPSFLKMLAL